MTTDELVSYKHKKVITPFEERLEIIRSIKCVNATIQQESMEKFVAWKKLQIDIMFVGNSWFGTEKWRKYEEQFQEVGVKIIYFPYYVEMSSTLINQTLQKLYMRDRQNKIIHFVSTDFAERKAA